MVLLGSCLQVLNSRKKDGSRVARTHIIGAEQGLNVPVQYSEGEADSSMVLELLDFHFDLQEGREGQERSSEPEEGSMQALPPQGLDLRAGMQAGWEPGQSASIEQADCKSHVEVQLTDYCSWCAALLGLLLYCIGKPLLTTRLHKAPPAFPSVGCSAHRCRLPWCSGVQA